MSSSVSLVANVGETIDNPVTGERITWVETARSTAGERLVFELRLRPAAAVAAEHRHIRQEEDFTVLDGTVQFELAGRERMVGEGGKITVPAGVAHRWWNAGEDEARVRVALCPALDSETFFETFFGLARDGKTNAKGIPGLLQIAVVFRDLGDSCPQLVKPPVAVQRGLFAVLAPIGRLVGRQATYAKHSPRHASLPN